MVHFRGPEPSSPVQGQDFTITASLGYGPYTFSWRIGDGDLKTKTQEDPELKIGIPKHTSGNTLSLHVEDGIGDEDSETFIIIEADQSG